MNRYLCFLAFLFPLLAHAQGQRLQGKILSEDAAPLAGATITLKGSSRSAVSDSRGLFTLAGAGPGDTLLVTSVGFAPREVPAARAGDPIILTRQVGVLDEAVVMAYGTTTRRLSTGSITKVSGDDLALQPLTNPVAALAGRVPGLVVTQTSGVPGAPFQVQIRGRSSLDPILAQNDPLFVVDGVPFEPGNTVVSRLTSAANNPTSISQGGLSPLSAINPADIASIEVLRDADATAIYGSRGANGVVLITTKRGAAGKTALALQLDRGWSRPTRLMEMLSTRDYLAMRREAFANDGLTPTNTSAPDLRLWDTTRQTDFSALLLGKTATTTGAQATLSGGTERTRFTLGGSYRRSTTVFSRTLGEELGAGHVSLTHRSEDKKFSAHFSGGYSVNNNELPATDLTRWLLLPPHLKVYEADGSLAWSEGGVPFRNVNNFENPLALLRQPYEARLEQTRGSLLLEYAPVRGLTLKSSLGYNGFATGEESLHPFASLDPTSGEGASASFAHSYTRSWIAEPQAEYRLKVGSGRFTALAGATFQEVQRKGTTLRATGYTSDLLLRAVDAAASVDASSSASQYRYQALFGRLQYHYRDRYLLNASARRDGSSRFGPERRWATFSAVGAGWIFSSEPWVKRALPFLSFGKLRASWGTTGNDQVGEYKFMDLWRPGAVYAGSPSLIPQVLFNPEFGWERTEKREGALELGLLKDRLLLTVARYGHRSSNQLVSYPLPLQSGFATVVQNLPARVDNTGWEGTLSVQAGHAGGVEWSASVNLTVPRSRLVSFPGLAASPYAQSYIEGEPLSVIYRYRYTGVDPATGLYTFEDVNKDGKYDAADFQVLGHTEPRWYGGLRHNVRFSGLTLDLLWEVRAQKGRNYLAGFNQVPGTLYNQPTLVGNRWTAAGAKTEVGKYSTYSGSPAGIAQARLSLSDGIYSDASFGRLRTASLSYDLPATWLQKARISGCRLYISGQNLLTITRYKGADPETGDFYRLPPLKTLSAGVQLNF